MERDGQKASERRLGIEAWRVKIADDCDAPLPDELQAAFEGRSMVREELQRAEGSSAEESSGPAEKGVTRPGP